MRSSVHKHRYKSSTFRPSKAHRTLMPSIRCWKLANLTDQALLFLENFTYDNLLLASCFLKQELRSSHRQIY